MCVLQVLYWLGIGIFKGDFPPLILEFPSLSLFPLSLFICWFISFQACDKDSQCGGGMCCAVSIWIKSIRICTPMGQVGDSCHPLTRKVSVCTGPSGISSCWARPMWWTSWVVHLKLKVTGQYRGGGGTHFSPFPPLASQSSVLYHCSPDMKSHPST